MLYNLKNAGLMAMVLTAGIKQKKTRNGKVEKGSKDNSVCVVVFFYCLFIVNITRKCV